jgi:hypothetical protein
MSCCNNLPSGVDVIVRFHDYSRIHELDRALFSLLNQAFTPVHPVIVTQNLPESESISVRAKVEAHNWVHVGHAQPTIINVAGQPNQDLRAKLLNAGIEKARYRFLSFLDSDDYLYGHAYSYLIEEMLSRRVSIAFGGIVCKHVRAFRSFVYTRHRIEGAFVGNGLSDLLEDNFCPIHSFVIDRSGVDTRDITFDTNLCRLEDYDFLLRFCSKYSAWFESRSKTIGVYNWHLDGRGSIQFHEIDEVKAKANQRAWNSARRHIWRLKSRLRDERNSGVV